ncbi:MAG: hypothetical protein GAK41_01505 [Burkholderia gladioli]|nr:MAG: hypothetical protein GAK41_01505 [Burkholderia gladioli]
MLIRTTRRRLLAGDDIPRGEITPSSVFAARRGLLRAAGAGAAFAAYRSPNPSAHALAATTNAKFV